METDPNPDFGELLVRLTACGLRVFAEFGLGGREATVPGVGLSAEDFASTVLVQYADGALRYDAARGELFSFLAHTLRNDVRDALRKAAHSRERARASLPRESTSENEPPSLDEMAAPGASIETLLEQSSFCDRTLGIVADEPELAEAVRTVFDLDLTKPREIAAELGISVNDFQNRKKRLRRRLIEYLVKEVTRR